MNTLERIFLVAILFSIFLTNPLKAGGNEKPCLKRDDLITVFLDFPYHNRFIRESIGIVNYVRDRQLSQVHVKITRHHSGSAGSNYVISFIGRQDFEGMNNEITFWAPGTNSEDQTRRGLLERIKLGLAPYIANTSLNDQITVNISEDFATAPATEMEDPWRNWVFEIYGGANYYEESTKSRFNSRWGFYADKISDKWKIRIRPYFNINTSSFENDDETVENENYRHGFHGFMIHSLGEHWSAGLFVNMLSSTFHNMDFNFETSPGIEYSFFPYSEATERAITLVYRMGMARNYYMETTIFGEDDETLLQQSLDLSFNFEQPWGSVRAGLEGSHYFHDFDANRLEFFSRFNLRLVKGLSLSFGGNLDLVNDLLTIPAEEASLEEILLQSRAQATSYQVYTTVGVAYRFGSSFSNVVNTRF
ncbi:hypothetical protein [Marinilabilia rubra]|nr:hypothetical protein [Marinilabilia rubra]